MITSVYIENTHNKLRTSENFQHGQSKRTTVNSSTQFMQEKQQQIYQQNINIIVLPHARIPMIECDYVSLLL